MKTLKVLLQEVVSGIKAWVNSNFAQESNAVHKTGNETVNGNKTFTGNVFQNQAGGVNVYCVTCDGAVKGDLTSSGMFSIVCKDGSNANMETSGLAAVYMGQDTSGSYVVLRADTSYNNTRYNASVSLDIDPTTANNNAIFRPRRDNTIDLGSSSYQFKNLYANNYYYKGTAWGLDKANVWGAMQTISYTGSNVSFVLKHTEIDIASTPTRNTWFYLNFYDVNSISVGGYNYSKRANGNARLYLNLRTKNTNSDIVEKNIFFETNQEGTVWNLYPSSDADIGLGISNNKWKSFNGINPGALSFPDVNNAISIDTTNWDLTGNLNYYTPPISGWLAISTDNSNITNYIRCAYGDIVVKANGNGQDQHNSVLAPVIVNVMVAIRIVCTSLNSVKLYPCLGNV